MAFFLCAFPQQGISNECKVASLLCRPIYVGKLPIFEWGEPTRIMFSVFETTGCCVKAARARRLSACRVKAACLRSPAQWAQQTARNDMPLNLAGPVPDALSAR